MRRRTVLKLLRADKAQPYGLRRARGSRRGRRGRRSILRVCPTMRDHSAMPSRDRIDWLNRELLRMSTPGQRAQQIARRAKALASRAQAKLEAAAMAAILERDDDYHPLNAATASEGGNP